MKILYIIHDNKKGGAALSFLDMLDGISKEHDVFVITPHKKGYIPDELDRRGIWHKSAHYYWWEAAKTGNPVIDAARFFMYRFLDVFDRIEAGKLARLAADLGIDIIHSNSSTIEIGRKVSEISGIPHVWHLRELGYEDFSLIPVNSKTDIDSIFKDSDAEYIAISEYVKNYFSEHTGDPGRIHVIYNGINSSYNYEKTADEFEPDTVRFLISGNYCAEKGQVDVAHAVGELVKQGVTGFKVYMAGRGDFAEVKDYLNKNGLSGYVVFCGLVADMLELRKKCDVEIVASRAEAFGRVTIEAMRASNPVIGSAAGGTVELIEDGVTGFLYEYKDNEALAERMKRFTDDPSLARRMGSRAYEWSAGRFTSDENIRQVLGIYRELRS